MNPNTALKNLSESPAFGVLKRSSDVDEAVEKLISLELPCHPDRPKNWDSVAALSQIIRALDNRMDAQVLDVGGERYSAILKQLQGVGFCNLSCINPIFKTNHVDEGISFCNGRAEHTHFPDNFFDAVTCLSVLEHGVDINGYFREMSRILKPKGILFTSVDYWCEAVDTKNQSAYGVPIKIFSKDDITCIQVCSKFFHPDVINLLNCWIFLVCGVAIPSY